MKQLIFAGNEMQEELVEIRRQLHQNPEVGKTLPDTKEFVKKKLQEYGYAPQEICESGIVATLEGVRHGKTLLLRADMDALPITEQSALPFASQNGRMHACGHDMHTTMLLGAAKLLKERQQEVVGKIKFVFQPDEEGFTGAKTMIEARVLNNPSVDAGMALHVHSGTPSGTILCGLGTCMAGCTLFRIEVQGIGCHGAMPETGVDSIHIAAQIYLSLQEILAREISPMQAVALTIGKFQAGEAANVIPECAVLEGSIRALDSTVGEYVYKRVVEIAQNTAKAFRGTAKVRVLASTPPLHNDVEMVKEMAGYIRELVPKQQVVLFEQGGMGSEDFAVFTERVPCAYLLLGAGSSQENEQYGKPMHNEGVIFNEEILSIGSSIFAYSALKWLKNHQ